MKSQIPEVLAMLEEKRKDNLLRSSQTMTPELLDHIGEQSPDAYKLAIKTRGRAWMMREALKNAGYGDYIKGLKFVKEKDEP